MEIEISPHSKTRNRKRKISIERIKSAIKSPEKVLYSFRSRKLFQKKFGEKTLEVVTVEETGKIVVITQYYLKEI